MDGKEKQEVMSKGKITIKSELRHRSNRINPLFLLIMALLCSGQGFGQDQITWKEKIELSGKYKYIRLCKVTKGPAAGDLIMTYFQSNHSAPFGMRRSKDEGRTWGIETIFMRNNTENYYVNPGILQLDDGRLMLSYCKRSKVEAQYIKEEGPCVRFSTDGGYTWGPETFICWGGAYEPAAIQVPNDENGDGNNDIYLFWTMAIVDQSVDLDIANHNNSYRGFACGVVASYDNGASWENFRPNKLGARIVHRNFDEPVNGTYFGSKGNMPTPVLLPNHRIGVVCEAVDKANSPWFTVSESGDWDWNKFQNQQWSSYSYFGYPPYSADDDNIYPTDRNFCWRPTFQDDTFGGAPYACVLPNGRIAFSQNSGHIIRVFVCDANGRNPVRQDDPFLNTQSFYSCIIPLNDHEVILAAHDPVDLSRAFIRIGEIRKDMDPPTQPKNLLVESTGPGYNLSWEPSTDNIVVHKYYVYANDSLVKEVLWDHATLLDGLDPDKNYAFSVRAVDYQGNVSELATSATNLNADYTIYVYPNPADQWLEIKTPWKEVGISVYSALGELIMRKDHFMQGGLDVSTYRKGIYILQIHHAGIKTYRKFVKN